MRSQFLVVVLVLLCALAQADLPDIDKKFLACVANVVEAAEKENPKPSKDRVVGRVYKQCYHFNPPRLQEESDDDYYQRREAALGDLDVNVYVGYLGDYVTAHSDQQIYMHGNAGGGDLLITDKLFPVEDHMDIWAPEDEDEAPIGKFGWLAIDSAGYDGSVKTQTMRVSVHVKSDLGDEGRTDAIWRLPDIAFRSGAAKLKMTLPYNTRTDTIVISFDVQGKNGAKRKELFDTFVENLRLAGMDGLLEGGDMLPPFQFRSANGLVCASDYGTGESFGLTLSEFMVGTNNDVEQWIALNRPVGNRWNFGVPTLGLEEQLHKLEQDLSNWM